MLRSADVRVNTVPLPEVLVATGGEATKLEARMNKRKARIAELESLETMTVRRHEELLNDA